MKCPKCRKEISDKLNICPFCGTPIAKDDKPSKSSGLSVAQLMGKTNKKPTMPDIKPAKEEPPANAQLSYETQVTGKVHPAEKAATKPAVTTVEAKAPVSPQKETPVQDEKEPQKAVEVKAAEPSKQEKPVEPVKQSKPEPALVDKSENKTLDTADNDVHTEGREASSDNEEKDESKEYQDGVFNPNADGYYNDVAPAVANEINKLPNENVFRIGIIAIAIVAIVLLLLLF